MQCHRGILLHEQHTEVVIGHRQVGDDEKREVINTVAPANRPFSRTDCSPLNGNRDTNWASDRLWFR
jgi:hypothetical protein